jgi:hypothetical protein
VLSADSPRQSEKLAAGLEIRPSCLLEAIMNANLLSSRSQSVVFPSTTCLYHPGRYSIHEIILGLSLTPPDEHME